jgi:hypothetical protein
MARHHDLAPRYTNLFFSSYMTIVVIGVFFGQFPLLLVHEWFHTLAGRRLGLSSSLGIGRRLYFMVFETSLDGLVTVPRRKRYLPILAGMLADLLVVAIFTMVAGLLRRSDGSQPMVGAICLAMAFATLLRFAWQFYFYLQTDLYLLIVTALGCVDLHKTARRTLANRMNRLLGRTDRLLDESCSGTCSPPAVTCPALGSGAPRSCQAELTGAVRVVAMLEDSSCGVTERCAICAPVP